MANALYDKGREGFLNGDIDWTTNNIKLMLLDSADYTANLSTHDFLDDIPSLARVATSSNLSSKTSTGGTADAAACGFMAYTGPLSRSVTIRRG